MKDKKRYSEASKLKVMEELRDGKWKTVADAAQAYGVSAQGVRYWMKRLGFEHLNGRIIYENGVFLVGESAEDIYRHAQAVTDRLCRE